MCLVQKQFREKYNKQEGWDCSIQKGKEKERKRGDLSPALLKHWGRVGLSGLLEDDAAAAAGRHASTTHLRRPDCEPTSAFALSLSRLESNKLLVLLQPFSFPEAHIILFTLVSLHIGKKCS